MSVVFNLFEGLRLPLLLPCLLSSLCMFLLLILEKNLPSFSSDGGFLLNDTLPKNNKERLIMSIPSKMCHKIYDKISTEKSKAIKITTVTF